MSAPDDIVNALHTIYDRLDTLSSIMPSQILTPGSPQDRYHEIVEETYAALGRLETEIDALREELEYQHKRLDAARDVALEEANKE
jgi:hypothetical protein